MSVASTVPLRSTMSGRAAEIAVEVARRRPTCSLGSVASITSRPVMAMNSAEKPRMTRPTRGWLFSPLIRKTSRSQARRRARRRPLASCAPASLCCWHLAHGRPPGVVTPLALRSLGVSVGSAEAEILELAADRVDLRPAIGNVGSAHDLRDLQRLQVEMAVGQRLQPVGPVEILPLGLQHGDGVALALRLGPELLELLGLERRLVFDRVGVDRRRDERADGDDMQQLDHAQGLRRGWGSGTSASADRLGLGRRATAPAVRSAARSLAERAREFSRISASDGATGPRVTSAEGRLVDGDDRRMARAGRRAAGAGGHELLDDAVLERMEGHDHQPPARLERGLGRMQRPHQLAELVIDGDAQRLEHPRRRMRAAGLGPDDARRRDRRAASWSRSRPLRRASMMARATARERRSSP